MVGRGRGRGAEPSAAQASVSHDHPQAIAAAQAVALAILLLRRGVPARQVRDRLGRDFGYDLRPETALMHGGFDVSAAGTMPPALTTALEAEGWEDAVRTAIGLGGDTDTLACIAGSVAEAKHGLPQPIADKARTRLTPDLVKVLDRFATACAQKR